MHPTDFVHYLFGVKRSNRWVVINLNTTTLLVVAVLERQLPSTLTLRCGEPQTHQMASGHWRSVVLVGGSGVENVVVGKELDITDLKNHVQRQPHAGVFEDLNSALLLLGESGDESLV